MNLTEEDDSTADLVVEIGIQILLFFLVLGFAATVHYKSFAKSLRSRGIFVGLAMQFIAMPLIGFLFILAVPDLEEVIILAVLFTVSCPGGAYSNFFTSVNNGDLSLSVAMTTVSTFASIFMLPLNLLVYLGLFLSTKSEKSIDELIDFLALGQTVGLVAVAIGLGLFINYKYEPIAKCLHVFANICGVFLIIGSVAVANIDVPLWENPSDVIIVSFFPPIVGTILTILVALKSKLDKPQVFACAIEVCMQNTSVAAAFIFTAFDGEEESKALAVTVLYGFGSFNTAIVLSVIAHNLGWTYAPEGTGFFKALVNDYQPKYEETKDKKDALDPNELL